MRKVFTKVAIFGELHVSETPPIQIFSALLWPSFIAAGLATIVFFTALDPVAVLECKGAPPLSHTAAYSLGFFGFWLLCLTSSAATAYYLKPVS